MRSDIVERAQGGDREAFDALATALYHRLFAVGRRILRDRYAAEDAVQETLIRGWRDLRSLRDPERFEAWMHRLLVHACHDQARRSRRHDLEVTAGDYDRSDPHDEYATIANRDELERAFLHLSVDQRAVLVMTHYLGLSAVEIGRMLGIPAGTVYSRLHYGSREMRTALARGSGDVVVTTNAEQIR